jgi:hypothetical protein
MVECSGIDGPSVVYRCLDGSTHILGRSAYSTLVKPVPGDSAGLAGVAFANRHRRLQTVGQLDEPFTDKALRVLFPSHGKLARPPRHMPLVTIWLCAERFSPRLSKVAAIQRVISCTCHEAFTAYQ